MCFDAKNSIYHTHIRLRHKKKAALQLPSKYNQVLKAYEPIACTTKPIALSFLTSSKLRPSKIFAGFNILS